MLLATALALCALTWASPAIVQNFPSSSNASLLWGPFRPNLYVGVRSRIPNSLLMGLMWSNADDPSDVLKNLRHTCEQNEGMEGYGWVVYDARKGGMHVVNDTKNKVDLTTQFVKGIDEKYQESWGLRVEGTPRTDAKPDQKTTVIFYLGNEDSSSGFECVKNTSIDNDLICKGFAVGIGSFVLRISNDRASSHLFQDMAVKSLNVPGDTIWQAKSIFEDQLKAGPSHVETVADDPGEGNLHFMQGIFDGNFQFDILFSSESNDFTSTSLTDGIQGAISTFDRNFALIYAPQSPFQDKQHIQFSKSLLSNLMGGIGYFFGKNKVDVSSAPEYTENSTNFWEEAALAQSRDHVETQGPHQLFSAVPSRPFFPRGFLWDEGFHLLVILDWDMDLALEIVSSWLNLMDENGWIAREQILGPEAESKVPPEFQTQYPRYANPPTLFLVVKEFVARLSGKVPYLGAPSRHLSHPATGKAFLDTIYPKMKQNYDWFCRTQAGNLEKYRLFGSDFIKGYRWRGRTPQHTLTSGLDDYPRAQPPHPEELHLDALSWVGSMTIALRKISIFIGRMEDEAMFSKHEADVVKSLDSIHWCKTNQAYCDTAMVDGKQVKRVCHKGYISLFPFLVGLIDPGHPNLEAILDLIRDPKHLWSPHGIRSLSLKDEYYGTDENYWRGPIWININYMIVYELLKLAQQPGPHQRKAGEMYTELRLNLVNTVFESWRDTGFAWEQYNPDTGKGQRTQHFTGWTSLIVRIMSMPDLQSGPQLQVWGSTNRRPTKHESWVKILIWTGIGLLLISLVFRRRLTRIWGAVPEAIRTIKGVLGFQVRIE